MASPTEQILLVDKKGERIDLDAFVERLRSEPERVLADDEIGFVAYVGDLDVYKLTPVDNGGFLAQKVNEISRPRQGGFALLGNSCEMNSFVQQFRPRLVIPCEG